ncbi:MAG: outer membrane beta-barrel protein [Pseudohongiellaceae bacterium]
MRCLFFLAALALSGTASAQVVVSGGYFEISEDSADLSFGGVAGSVGYIIEMSPGFTIVPEMRLGTGTKDDSAAGFDFEVKSFYSVLVRGEWAIGDRFYAFLAPSYSNLDIEASGFGFNIRDDDWEIGGGAGLGFRITDYISIEAAAEKYENVDVLTVGLRFGI